ncbi:MAG: hypothetical protein OXI46_08585 [Gemmatimonadota bacterium]|nr:hypothetical protein [Gemmatimonadota bacterium]
MLKQPMELWHLLLASVILVAAIVYSHQQTHVEMAEALGAHDHELHAVQEELEEEIHAIRETVAELQGHMAHDEEGADN